MSQMQGVAEARPRMEFYPRRTKAIPIVTLGLSLSLFFVISYVIYIAGYLLLPGFPLQHRRCPSFCRGSYF